MPLYRKSDFRFGKADANWCCLVGYPSQALLAEHSRIHRYINSHRFTGLLVQIQSQTNDHWKGYSLDLYRESPDTATTPSFLHLLEPYQVANHVVCTIGWDTEYRQNDLTLLTSTLLTEEVGRTALGVARQDAVAIDQLGVECALQASIIIFISIGGNGPAPGIEPKSVLVIATLFSVLIARRGCSAADE